jgi:HK97 gp10 family phage protein
MNNLVRIRAVIRPGSEREVKQQLTTLFVKASAEVRQATFEFAERLVKRAQELAPESSGDLKKSIKSVPVKVERSTVSYNVISDSYYAPFVEFGSKKHPWPPPEPLFKWLADHPDFAPEYSDDSRAYLLGKAIHERGGYAQPFMTPAAEEKRGEFVQLVIRAAESAILDTARGAGAHGASRSRTHSSRAAR